MNAETAVDRRLETSPDQQLVTVTLRGDSKAFEHLVRRHQDRLFRSIRHFVGSYADAEDLIQDTFVQAYVKLASFEGRAAFYTWLFRIAMNLVHTRARRLHSRVALERCKPLADTDPPDTTVTGNTAGESLMQRETAAQIEQALDALTDEHRTVLVLRGVEGLDYATIADLLQISIGTVRSRLHRARLQFRDQLDQRSCLSS